MKPTLQIAAVCDDLASVLHNGPLAQQLVAIAAQLKEIHPAVSQAFARWLLLDPHHGLRSMSDHADLIKAIDRAAADVCRENVFQLYGMSVEDKEARRHLETTQQAMWIAYYTAQARTDQFRVDWMVAQAVGCIAAGNLTDAMHCAAVAWTARHKNDEMAEPRAYYRIARDACIRLFATTQLAQGEHVEFDHLVHGRNTGAILHLMPDADPPRAMVQIDHRLRGVVWSVPVAELSRTMRVPA